MKSDPFFTISLIRIRMKMCLGSLKLHRCISNLYQVQILEVLCLFVIKGEMDDFTYSRGRWPISALTHTSDKLPFIPSNIISFNLIQHYSLISMLIQIFPPVFNLIHLLIYLFVHLFIRLSE